MNAIRDLFIKMEEVGMLIDSPKQDNGKVELLDDADKVASNSSDQKEPQGETDPRILALIHKWKATRGDDAAQKELNVANEITGADMDLEDYI